MSAPFPYLGPGRPRSRFGEEDGSPGDGGRTFRRSPAPSITATETMSEPRDPTSDPEGTSEPDVAEEESSPPVYICADESCLGNQFRGRANPGGAAGVVEVWKDEIWHRRDYWYSERDTTNNRMALGSAILPLRLLTRPCSVVFISDSQYLVRGISEWLPSWKARGWKRKKGPIENLDLWKRLDRVCARHEVEWRWIRGHAGHPQNEYANDLAIRAARKGDRSDGFVESGFVEWLNDQRERREKYLDFFEFLPPEKLHPPDGESGG